jgi:hypothetical protein
MWLHLLQCLSIRLLAREVAFNSNLITLYFAILINLSLCKYLKTKDLSELAHAHDSKWRAGCQVGANSLKTKGLSGKS